MRWLIFTSLLLGLNSIPVLAQAGEWQYPPARQDKIVENYHGTPVADPYRWLENPASPETQAWVTAQNTLSSAFLAVPYRDTLKKRLEALWNYPKLSTPSHRGDYYYFWKNDGLQNQYVLYRQKSLDQSPTVILDPNTLSTDGTASVGMLATHKNGQLMAYGVSRSGSDQQEIYIRNLTTGQNFKETIPWAKFSQVAWHPQGQGFFYNRYPIPAAGAKVQETKNNRVYWHTLNTPVTQDTVVFERPELPDLDYYPYVTEDGQYLCITAHQGTSPKNRFYYRPMAGGSFVKLLDQADASYSLIGNQGPVFYFQTDLNASRGRVIAIDTRQPEPKHWREILPQAADVMTQTQMIAGHLVVVRSQDVKERIEIYDLQGQNKYQLPLPAVGTIGSITGQINDPDMFFSFTSYLSPGTTYRYHFAAQKLEVYRQPQIKFDGSAYESHQVFFKSKDGTRVPMFITHKKGLKKDGSNPVLLYGYGGFNVSLTPHFSPTNVVWLENGGIYAVANLRGGSEYGESWHEGGMLGQKQHVFDDFIGAADWLVQEKYTSPQRLAIQGGSNGGLLTAAVMEQRPDLFGAVLSQVPVTDMLRYHEFTVGRYWVPEYGNAKTNPDHFKFLMAYSPLHNVKAVAYPALLVMTAEQDDRVVPAHAYKWVATLQAKAKSTKPLLIRVETKAGHGAGKPTTKMLEEWVDIYAFLFKALGLSDPVKP